jgi:hypothetical protein
MSNEDLNEKYFEGLRKLLSESYSQAKSYTNLIIVAGYASYFTAINYCKEHITTTLFLWSIMLMGISITLFVSHEVYGMISNTINLRKLQDALSDKVNYIKNLEAYSKTAQEEKIRIGRIWSYHLYPTVIFAILSLLLFMLPIIYKLLGQLFSINCS